MPDVRAVFEAASEKHPDVVFGKVDTEAEQGLAGTLNIPSIPTLIANGMRTCLSDPDGAADARELERVFLSLA